MWLIRGFLWSLVASVCYQGYHSPQTSSAWIGSAWIGSAWIELGFSSTKAIPRVFVQEAIKETQKHPRLLEIPTIQKRLVEVKHTLDYLRKSQLLWRLDVQDIITSLQVEKPWRHAVSRVKELQKKVGKESCWLPTQGCREKLRLANQVKNQIRSAKEDPWLSLMRYETVTAMSFIQHNYIMSRILSDEVHGLYKAFEDLYNVTAEDARISSLSKTIDRLSWSFKGRSQLVKILMLGDLWSACMSHTISQDHRIHSLLDRSGIIEVQHIRERIYNVSVSGLTSIDHSMVSTWFDEAGIWSWWLPDTIPAIVRRCVTQTTGDCKRIGSTEIDSLMSRSDMSKSIHVGLWSGLPLVLSIFASELLTEYFKKSPPMMISLGLPASTALVAS
jgi:hypothetical protein